MLQAAGPLRGGDGGQSGCAAVIRNARGRFTKVKDDDEEDDDDDEGVMFHGFLPPNEDKFASTAQF